MITALRFVLHSVLLEYVMVSNKHCCGAPLVGTLVEKKKKNDLPHPILLSSPYILSGSPPPVTRNPGSHIAPRPPPSPLPWRACVSVSPFLLLVWFRVFLRDAQIARSSSSSSRSSSSSSSSSAGRTPVMLTHAHKVYTTTAAALSRPFLCTTAAPEPEVQQ